MSRPLSASTPAQLEAVIDIVRAVADAIRDLTEANGGVPSGELYAHLMAAGMNLEQYNAVLDALRNAGVISINNHWIRFIGKVSEA